ncbi:MAG: SDR family oxidoreductase [Candidatus Hadarchaeota archaeon]
MNENYLEGKKVLVFGANSDAGLEIVRRLKNAGTNLATSSNIASKLKKISNEAKENYKINPILKTTPWKKRRVEESIQKAVNKFGGLDIVVYNIQISHAEDPESLKTFTYRNITRILVDELFFITKKTVPHLLKSKGKLVFVYAKTSENRRIKKNPIFEAGEKWVEGFSLSVQARYGKEGIGVIMIKTGIGNEKMKSNNVEKCGDLPNKEIKPEEVAEAVQFSVNQENAVLTKITI